MDKNSFLEALRNIFKKARVADVESIIEVYEEHFAVGYERGLTDSEIIKSLGTPEEIYTSYVDAGIITDTLGQDGGDSKSVNMQEIYARFDDYKEAFITTITRYGQKSIQNIVIYWKWFVIYCRGFTIYYYTCHLIFTRKLMATV